MVSVKKFTTEESMPNVRRRSIIPLLIAVLGVSLGIFLGVLLRGQKQIQPTPVVQPTPTTNPMVIASDPKQLRDSKLNNYLRAIIGNFSGGPGLLLGYFFLSESLERSSAVHRPMSETLHMPKLIKPPELRIVDVKDFFPEKQTAKATIYFFWFESCIHCKGHMEVLQDLSPELQEKDIEVIWVNNVDDSVTIRNFFKGKKLTPHIVKDIDSSLTQKIANAKPENLRYPFFVLATREKATGKLTFQPVSIPSANRESYLSLLKE